MPTFISAACASPTKQRRAPGQSTSGGARRISASGRRAGTRNWGRTTTLVRSTRPDSRNSDKGLAQHAPSNDVSAATAGCGVKSPLGGRACVQSTCSAYVCPLQPRPTQPACSPRRPGPWPRAPTCALPSIRLIALLSRRQHTTTRTGNDRRAHDARGAKICCAVLSLHTRVALETGVCEREWLAGARRSWLERPVKLIAPGSCTMRLQERETRFKLARIARGRRLTDAVYGQRVHHQLGLHRSSLKAQRG